MYLYSEHNVARSIAYQGSGHRLRRVLQKAERGEPIKLAVLGGSVSAGHGVKSEENWSTVIQNWFQETFPRSPVSLINGAIPATGSDYYSSCFMGHIDEGSDIIFIELAVNDQFSEGDAKSYEWLLRTLLALPSKPAIIHVQTMGLVFNMIATGGDMHLAVAQYYDTPVVSIRHVLLPHFLALDEPDRAEKWWFGRQNSETSDQDTRHVRFSNSNTHMCN